MGGSLEVDEYMRSLDHRMASEVGILRDAILGIDARIGESIKWNAPSFFINEHFATFNLHYPDRIQVVLHTGAKVNPDAVRPDVDDPAGLLRWAAVDRASVDFSSSSDVEVNLDAFVAVVRQWIDLTT